MVQGAASRSDRSLVPRIVSSIAQNEGPASEGDWYAPPFGDDWDHAAVPQEVASDLVERRFWRDEPDRLWVTDSTEHPTTGGQGLLPGRPRPLEPLGGRLVERLTNAVIESFWSRMRVELANAIFEYLEVFHDRQRRHSALGMLTPTRRGTETVA